MAGKFTIVRRGYSPEEVDGYLKTVKDYVEKLEDAFKESEREVESLSRKLGAFESKEAAINNAIVNSQISADSILMSARNAAENIVQNAKSEAEMEKEAIYSLLADIAHSLLPRKKHIQNFRQDYEELMTKYFKDFDEKDFAQVTGAYDALENYINKLTKQDTN